LGAAVQTLKGPGEAGSRVSGRLIGGRRDATSQRATRALRRAGIFGSGPEEKNKGTGVSVSSGKRRYPGLWVPAEDMEAEKGYGARGFVWPL